jgi:hypothetical protein
MVKGKLAPQAFCVTGRYHPCQNFREHFGGIIAATAGADFHGGKTVPLN